jgi:hypothetical protein
VSDRPLVTVIIRTIEETLEDQVAAITADRRLVLVYSTVRCLRRGAGFWRGLNTSSAS